VIEGASLNATRYQVKPNAHQSVKKCYLMAAIDIDYRLSARALALSRDISRVCQRLLGLYRPDTVGDYEDEFYYEDYEDYEEPPCGEVHRAICDRDLKLHACIRLLLGRRYIAEAGILLLAQLESSVYLLHIGQDSTRAQKWLNHKQERYAPDPGLEKRLADVFKQRQPVLDHYLWLYKELSMIKHANPRTRTDPSFYLFGSPRMPVPSARELRDLRNLKDEKQRFIFLLNRNWNFDEERVHAHWIIGESCELLMKVFGRFVDWHGDDISAQKGGPAALKNWKHLCRRWARVKPPDW